MVERFPWHQLKPSVWLQFVANVSTDNARTKLARRALMLTKYDEAMYGIASGFTALTHDFSGLPVSLPEIMARSMGWIDTGKRMAALEALALEAWDDAPFPVSLESLLDRFGNPVDAAILWGAEMLAKWEEFEPGLLETRKGLAATVTFTQCTITGWEGRIFDQTDYDALPGVDIIALCHSEREFKTEFAGVLGIGVDMACIGGELTDTSATLLAERIMSIALS
jgi:hypothetical protein